MIFSRLKFTPLTLVIAICITYALAMFLGLVRYDVGLNPTAQGIYTLVLAAVFFISDLIFRKILNNAKWIWLIETAFIILTVAMILIFKEI